VARKSHMATLPGVTGAWWNWECDPAWVEE